MSLPFLLSGLWEDLEYPERLIDQHFGLGINPKSLVVQSHYVPSMRDRMLSRRPTSAYYRPWGSMLRQGEGGASTVKADKDNFEVVLDVQQFAPEEINVKVIDKSIIVEGKHEEKRDEHGWISRQFSRRYLIPEQCDLDQVVSKLSSDGVLSIIVPKKTEAIEGSRNINIEHTGKPAIRENNAKSSETKE